MNWSTNNTAAWQLNGVINRLNLYVGHLSTDMFFCCCLFYDAVSLSGYIASTVGRLAADEFELIIPVGIWTEYLPSVCAVPTCLVDRYWIQCNRKYEFCKCSFQSLLSSPGSHEAPECPCPFVVPSWNVVTLLERVLTVRKGQSLAY
jgi:hypothetical protein